MLKTLLLSLLLCTTISYSQSITGKWITVDDITGLEKSIVNIYEENGKIYGKIIKRLNQTPKDITFCDLCPGKKKGKPIIGLRFIENLTKDGNEYSGGIIIDPKQGKTYKCKIELLTNGTLEVRGFIGFSLLGRSQYWKRKL